MAVSLPIFGFAELDNPFDFGMGFARSQGGLVITSRSGDPVVRGTMTSGDLEIPEFQDLNAFLVDCVDRHLRVDFVHPRHRQPIAYATGTLPFSGTGEATSFPDLRTLRMAELPVGLVLKRGDWVGLEQTGMRLCRWIREDTIVSSAITQDLPLTPRLPIGVFEAGALVRFKDPVLRHIVVPGSVKAPEHYGPTPITWEIEEVLQ